MINGRTTFGAALLVIGLGISGCTTAQKLAVDRGIEAARQAKDAEAEALKAAVCAMSIGAYHRTNNGQERRALDVLCGGDWDRPITADDVRLIQRLGDAKSAGSEPGRSFPQ